MPAILHISGNHKFDWRVTRSLQARISLSRDRTLRQKQEEGTWTLSGPHHQSLCLEINAQGFLWVLEAELNKISRVNGTITLLALLLGKELCLEAITVCLYYQ